MAIPGEGLVAEVRAQQRVPIDSLALFPGNPRVGNIEAIARSLDKLGQYRPIVVREGSMEVLGGNHTLMAARTLGWTEIDISVVECSDEEARAIVLADNRLADLGTYDTEALAALVSSLSELPDLLEASAYTPLDLETLLGGPLPDGPGRRPGGSGPAPGPTLAERFLVPPFSVLDARQGYWQARKARWLEMGIESEVGREENLLGMSETILEQTSRSGTSVFDPVLCEIAYRWFCPPGGKVLDPFAGGSVRGIVAGRLGLAYCGIDLRPEQIDANRVQAAEIGFNEGEPPPEWHIGDARDIDGRWPGDSTEFDLLFSCPPYYDLEQYSDDPADLSNATDYIDFEADMRKIIEAAVGRLAHNRFCFWVVGEIRDTLGLYRGFVPDTIRAFEEAGASFYNEGILVTPAASLALRAERIFRNRKLAKGHQNVLVFVKGDPLAAVKACGPVEIADPTELFGEPGDPGVG